MVWWGLQCGGESVAGGGRADTLTLLPDSLPDLPLKEQELLAGCPTRQTAAGMARPLSEAKSQQSSLGHQHWREGWDLGAVSCPGRISFLSGSEATVEGNPVLPVSRNGSGSPWDSCSLWPRGLARRSAAGPWITLGWREDGGMLPGATCDLPRRPSVP